MSSHLVVVSLLLSKWYLYIIYIYLYIIYFYFNVKFFLLSVNSSFSFIMQYMYKPLSYSMLISFLYYLPNAISSLYI